MSLLPCVKATSAGHPARYGMTLLELIVALGILAVLSTVAVRALDPLADQARYEATQRLLTELRDATVGERSARQLNGQRMITGFLADTGQLPSDLDHFLEQPIGIVAHSLQSFDSNRDSVNDVTLSSGWRGPYLHLRAGQNGLLDGWGRAPLIDPDGGDFDFTSLGSDNDSIAPEDGFRADITVTIPTSEFLSSVVFRLFAIDAITGTRIDPSPTGLEQLGVLLYCVNGNGGTTGAIQERLLPVSASGSFEVSIENFIHGVAAARGVLWSDTDSDNSFDVGETLVLSSYVHYFTVVGGSDVRIEMELR
jgi:prepilin-type N-terminal cleavage/methylation domain-containing protein